MTTAGKIEDEYKLPSGSQPNAITASNGNMWFTDYGTNKIGVIAP